MAANTQPIFPLTPNIGHAVISAADASYTAPTASQTVLTAGANGTRINGMKIRALGTNIPTVMRFFIKDGTSYYLLYELALAASTASIIAPAQSADIVLYPINYDNMGGSTAGNGVLPTTLKSGQSLVVTLGTAVAAGYCVIGDGGDY